MRDIALILKKARKDSGLTAKKVSEYLRSHADKGYSVKTFYGWERGVSQPSIGVFLELMDLYGYDIVPREGANTYSLTDREWKMVKAYRDSPDWQDSVDHLLRIDEEGEIGNGEDNK